MKRVKKNDSIFNEIKPKDVPIEEPKKEEPQEEDEKAGFTDELEPMPILIPSMEEKTMEEAIPKKKKMRKLDFFNKTAIAIIVIFLGICMSIYLVVAYVVNEPNSMTFRRDGLVTISNSRIFDSGGDMIYEFGQEIREDVAYEELPQTLVDAFLAIEDSRFFEHNGFDIPRFLAAAMNNLKNNDFSQGGSTISMQMIDNAFTSNQTDKILKEKGKVGKLDQIKLKIQEIYLAMIAEQSVTKKEIFEYYVNRVWFGSGNNTRGIQKASQYYFGKDVTELNLNESAFLAGAVNAPNEYNPLCNLSDPDFDHLEAGTKRRNTTLDLMLTHGYITKKECKLAKQVKLANALHYEVKDFKSDPNEAYIAQVIDEVTELTGQDPSIIPMDIYTSLNRDLQNQSDKICKGEIIEFPNPLFDVGFTILDNKTGEILAVGPGRTYHTDAVKVDTSLDRKQPGSSMKPIVAYSSTFDVLGWSTEHAVDDKKKDYWHNNSYVNNSDGKFSGKISLSYALGVSKNTCAAEAMEQLINRLGYDYWVNFIRECGYDKDVAENFNEQYSIGGSDMWASPIQQASAYSMFANNGVRIDAHRVRNVIMRTSGDVIPTNAKKHQIISPGAAFMMSTLLYRVVNGGYLNFNHLLADSYPCYGKSGTSDWGDAGLQYGIPQASIRDEWSIGYTSQFTVAVWSGYTEIGFTQGYYIPTNYVSSYTQAFEISNYLLDYAKPYGDYHMIPATDDVVAYGGGYIKSEFYNLGDSITNSTGTQKRQ
ncbi:MAG: transglycosylase domain-containing protein [Firmicutes bacterium]|nr:transglycosylase domain-containing protein [Bacillota bacterium]